MHQIGISFFISVSGPDDTIDQNAYTWFPSLQYKTKVHEKTILLDDKPVDYGERKAARLEKKRKRAARKGLPRLVTREMFRKVPPEMVNWEMCLELHYLWKEYIVDLLDLKPDQHNYANLSAINDKLTRCDFHGAVLNIIQSRVPTNIGKSGIVVKETENMFYLVTRYISNDYQI